MGGAGPPDGRGASGREPSGVATSPPDATWGPGVALLGIVAGVFAGQLALSIVSSGLGRTVTVAGGGPLWALVVSSAALQLVTGGIAVVVASRHPDGAHRALGIEIHRLDLPLGAVVGALAQLAAVPLLYLPLRHWISMDELERPARELVGLVHGSGDRLLLVLMVCVGAPLAEELMFRGLLLRALLARLGRWPAVLASSLVFGLVHFQSNQLPGLVMFGVVSAVLAVRTGRLGPSVAAHVAFNAVTVVGLLS